MGDTLNVTTQVHDTVINSTSKFQTLSIHVNDSKKEILGVSSDTWATIIITLLVFFLGFILSFTGSKISLYSKMWRNQKFVSFWIDSIKDAVERQVKELRTFAEQIKNPDNVPAGLGRVNLHMDKLKAISSVEYVQTFVFNKIDEADAKHKLLYELSSQSDLIERIHNNNEYFLETWKKMAKSYQEEWEKNIHEITNWHGEIHKQFGDALWDDESFAAIFKIREEWIANTKVEDVKDARPVEWTKKEFIDKIMPVLKEQFEKYPGNHHIGDLAKLVSRLEITYKRKVFNLGEMGDRFNENAGKMEGAYTKLVSAKNRLIKIPFKCFLFLD
jgi:hypothetical protein